MSDLSSDVGKVKNTFSSWDSCMAQSYCKYPVIVAIIIASLIVLSVVSCIVRCCCCGMECCCACCSCFNACCPSPRNKRTKSPDQRPYGPSAYQGYQPNPPPLYGQGFNNQPAQFAQFDSGRKVHADSLPTMPSWDTAPSRKVLDNSHHEELEMDHLAPADEAAAPMLAHQAPPPSGPHGDAFVEGAAAPLPYQDRTAHNGGDLGDAYGQHNQGAAQQYYGTGLAGSDGRAPQGGSIGRSSVPPPQGYNDGRAQYGIAAGPPQSYNDGRAQYGIAAGPQSSSSPSFHAGGSPLSHQQAPYRGVFPTAISNDPPSALQPAALASRPTTQQLGSYQSYTPHIQQPAQSTYSAYAPSTDSSTLYEPSHSGQSAAGIPPMRKPAPQQVPPQMWRDI